jgi:hypothetical protein
MNVLAYIVVTCLFLVVYIYIDGVTHDKDDAVEEDKYYKSKYEYKPDEYDIWRDSLD